MKKSEYCKKCHQEIKLLSNDIFNSNWLDLNVGDNYKGYSTSYYTTLCLSCSIKVIELLKINGFHIEESTSCW